MTPFKLAWKITQFVLWITLLLGVIPSALFYGGVYAIAKYEAWQEYRHMPYCEFTLPSGLQLPAGYEDAQPVQSLHANGGIGYDHGHQCKMKKPQAIDYDKLACEAGATNCTPIAWDEQGHPIKWQHYDVTTAVCMAFDDGTWGLIPQQNIDAALKDGGHIVPCASIPPRMGHGTF